MGASSSFMDMDFKAPFAEVKAILEGLQMAKSLGCGKVVIESDCAQAVKCVSRRNEVWGKLEPVIEDIWALFPCFSKVYFSHISREINCVADYITKKPRLLELSDTWINSILRWIMSLVEDDRFSYCP